MPRFLVAAALALLVASCGAAQPAPEAPQLSPNELMVNAVAPLPVPTAGTRVEMPWVWRILRREVYARLPRVESHPQRGANAVFSPVIVDGPYDSVPGVGAEGRF